MVESWSAVNNPPNRPLSKEEIIAWLEEEDPDRIKDLYRKADQLREEFMGDEVHIR